MQFDFLPHSKLNLLSLLLPKKYAMFLCPQLKSQQKEIRMSICAYGCVCVCVCDVFKQFHVEICYKLQLQWEICIKFPYAFLLSRPDSHFAFDYISPNDLHKNAASLTNFTCR